MLPSASGICIRAAREDAYRVFKGQVCVLQVESWWVASVLVTLGTLPRLFLSWQPMAACKASEISRTTQSINGLSRAVVFRRNEHLRSASDIVV